MNRFDERLSRPLQRAQVARTIFTVWLSRLEIALRQQFAREEGPTGLFAFICRSAPRYVSFIDKLRDDHLQILQAVRQLRAATDGGAPLEQLHARREALTAILRQHNELEYEVLEDSLLI